MAHYKFKGWVIFDYYQWLLEKIDGHKEPYYDYSLLLNELHSIRFDWGLENDSNRADDGERLRWEYMDEENIPDLFYKDGVPCSVLEMLIALSIRCNNEIMWDPREDHTAEFFWVMIENLDLMRCTDEHFSMAYVHQQIGRWINRDFRRNGKGSPFPLKERNVRDQRKVTIWQQMCGYISEKYFDG